MNARPLRAPRFLALLWSLMLAGPLAWAAGLGASLPLAALACERGTRAPLAGVHAVTFVVAVFAGWIAWRYLARLDGADDEVERSRFMLQLGVGLSAISALAILAGAIALPLLEACPT